MEAVRTAVLGAHSSTTAVAAAEVAATSAVGEEAEAEAAVVVRATWRSIVTTSEQNSSERVWRLGMQVR